VLTDSDDTEMFDNSEEDKDLASQVSKKSTSADENGHEVIGSPVTPEKLDPKFDRNQKASGSASSTEGKPSAETGKEGDKVSQTAAKKEA
jgi:protein phosphatase PTC2/3